MPLVVLRSRQGTAPPSAALGGASSFLLVPAGIGLFVVRGWVATLYLWESRRRQRRPGRRKTEVLQDPTCHARAGDVRDELHPAAAHRAGKHIDGEDLLEQLSPRDAACTPGRDGALGAGRRTDHGGPGRGVPCAPAAARVRAAEQRTTDKCGPCRRRLRAFRS